MKFEVPYAINSLSTVVILIGYINFVKTIYLLRV